MILTTYTNNDQIAANFIVIDGDVCLIVTNGFNNRNKHIKS